MNIIGDIAGNFLTLQALLKKMPKDIVLSLGDMVDRGPRSKEVLDWFMDGNGLALMGNHEHMMIDYVLQRGRYQREVWFYNGGLNTLQSFFPGADAVTPAKQREVLFPYVAWMRTLPLSFEEEGLFASHAPWSSRLESEFDRLWNRADAEKKKKAFQVHGHNAAMNPQWYSDKWGSWGVNIDTSRARVLTGIHWPSRQIFQQEYIDEPWETVPSEDTKTREILSVPRR